MRIFRQLQDKIRLLFKKDRESYLRFYRILGFCPRKIKYYQAALRHRSYCTRQGVTMNNERLEFLGDAVLDAVVGDLVFQHFADRKEGFLTNARSKIVQRETLNKLAVDIGLDKMVQYSYSIVTHKNNIYGNAFEALMGAIYLDQGYYRCKEFFEQRILKNYINLDQLAMKEINFKSHLMEWSQKRRVDIVFQLVNQDMEDAHNYTFESIVMLEGEVAGRGKGYSKKESHQVAARKALGKLRNDGEFTKRIIEKAKSRQQAAEEPKAENESAEADA